MSTMNLTCFGGVAGFYYVRKIKKNKIISSWIGNRDFDQLTGRIVFKKNGNDQMFVNPSLSKRGKRKWSIAIRKDAMAIGDDPELNLNFGDQGLFYFDPKRHQVIVSSEIDPSCFWDSDWFMRFTIRKKDMEIFSCSD